MKSKIIWQWAALFSLSVIFMGCKKEIKSTEADKLMQDNGSSSTLGITCIPNGIQFLVKDSLSQKRGQTGPLGIGLSNKVLFIGGTSNVKGDNDISKRVDIYNTTTGSWTEKTLSERKWYPALAAAGTKIGIAGGDDPFTVDATDRVDIYDVSTDTWTVSHLSHARRAIAGVGYGNFLYFAGGDGGGSGGGLFKTIDVYNTLDGTWSKLTLPKARTGITAAATNNKIVFAGGEDQAGYTDRADIYDLSTGTWSTGLLSRPRANMAAAALGNLIIFAGGNNDLQSFNDIDVYNTTTGFWSIAEISNASFGRIQAASQGTKMFFGGNGNFSGPSVVNVYDVCSNTWSNLSLTDGRGEYGIGAAGDKVLFGGGDVGHNTIHSKVVDIFNLGPLIAQ